MIIIIIKLVHNFYMEIYNPVSETQETEQIIVSEVTYYSSR